LHVTRVITLNNVQTLQVQEMTVKVATSIQKLQ